MLGAGKARVNQLYITEKSDELAKKGNKWLKVKNREPKMKWYFFMKFLIQRRYPCIDATIQVTFFYEAGS